MATGPAAGASYVIRGGVEGKRRLELLGRTLWPTTHQLLRRVGIPSGAMCADVGCGGGDVTLGIARMTGPEGRVIGADLDEVKLAAARQEAARQGLHHVEFRVQNVLDWQERNVYDRVYCRFVLTHLPYPQAAVERMRGALVPGGVLIVEDIDFTGCFCYPPCAAFTRYVELYQRVVRRRAADPDIGLRLYRLVLEAGFHDVQLSLVQPVHTNQEEKQLSLSTLINIADSVVSEGLAERAEIERIICELERFSNDPTTIAGLPRIFQVCARRRS